MAAHIGLRSSRSLNSISELSHFAESLQTIDQVYRLLVNPELLRAGAVDFRKKSFREIRGARLDTFNLSSPPDLSVLAEVDWISAVLIILVGYKDLKSSLNEAADDAKVIAEGISGLTADQLSQVDVGVRLILDRLLQGAETDLKGLLSRIEKARSHINNENIEIKVQNIDGED
jgi:hypothetical protein